MFQFWIHPIQQILFGQGRACLMLVARSLQLLLALQLGDQLPAVAPQTTPAPYRVSSRSGFAFQPRETDTPPQPEDRSTEIKQAERRNKGGWRWISIIAAVIIIVVAVVGAVIAAGAIIGAAIAAAAGD
jgi:anti-sigma-K factor RskA